MTLELIGEFVGKNIVYRILPDGKIETSNQGTGKFLGIDAYIMSTAMGVLSNGNFSGELNGLLTTVDGNSILLKGTAISIPNEKGVITTKAASYQRTESEKLMRFNKVLLLHEYETDMAGNWKSKIWEWKQI